MEGSRWARGSRSCQWTPSPSHLCPLEAWSDEPFVFRLWPTGSFPRPGILIKGIKRQRESGSLRSSDLRMETGSSNMSSEMREPLRTVVFHEFLSFPCSDKAVATLSVPFDTAPHEACRKYFLPRHRDEIV
jgi:hypothetical protein